MKKNSIKNEHDIVKQSEEEADVGEESLSDMADVNSIQEFIELKKLQNRVLGKMLEKINQPENQTKSNNK
jgi:hypothetical protein